MIAGQIKDLQVRLWIFGRKLVFQLRHFVRVYLASLRHLFQTIRAHQEARQERVYLIQLVPRDPVVCKIQIFAQCFIAAQHFELLFSEFETPVAVRTDQLRWPMIDGFRAGAK